MCVFSHDVFSETIMFLHEIFHQGLKARIANWPTLVLGKLRLDDTQNTHIHTVCIRSAAVQLHQGQVFSLSNSNVTLDVLLAHSLSLSHTHTHAHTHSFPYLSPQPAHSLSVKTMTSWTRRHPTHSPPKTEASSTDKHHQGDRRLKDTKGNDLWQLQIEKGMTSLFSDPQPQADAKRRLLIDNMPYLRLSCYIFSSYCFLFLIVIEYLALNLTC